MPRWSFVLCDRLGEPITDITGIATGRQLSYRLNRPSGLKFTVPSDHERVATVHTDGSPFLSELRVVKGWRDGVLRFAGHVWVIEDEADGDEAKTGVQCFDPLMAAHKRWVRDATDSVVDKYVHTTSPSFLAYWIPIRSSSALGPFGLIPLSTANVTANDPATPPTWSFEYRSIGAMLIEMADMDYLDINVVPRDVPDGNIGELRTSPYLGTLKENLILAWGTAANTCTRMSRTADANAIANRLHYFGAQKTGDQRPRALRTDATSGAKYGWWEDAMTAADIQAQPFIDALADEAMVYRKQPKILVSATPLPERMVPWDEFWLGDSFQVRAGPRLRAGFSGTQRCYGFDLGLDDAAGLETVQNILTSPEGAL